MELARVSIYFVRAQNVTSSRLQPEVFKSQGMNQLKVWKLLEYIHVHSNLSHFQYPMYRLTWLPLESALPKVYQLIS